MSPEQWAPARRCLGCISVILVSGLGDWRGGQLADGRAEAPRGVVCEIFDRGEDDAADGHFCVSVANFVAGICVLSRSVISFKFP